MSNIVIFDFDGVLFNTLKFKSKIAAVLERYDPRFTPALVERRYAEMRTTKEPFSLITFLLLFLQPGQTEDAYGELLGLVTECLNQEAVNFLRKQKKENCFLVTNGDEEFQNDKINAAGLRGFFNKVRIVPGSKEQPVEEICATYPNEKVIFTDDKPEFFTDLDLKKYPNLVTVQYEGPASVAELELASASPLAQEMLRHGSKFAGKFLT